MGHDTNGPQVEIHLIEDLPRQCKMSAEFFPEQLKKLSLSKVSKRKDRDLLVLLGLPMFLNGFVN